MAGGEPGRAGQLTGQPQGASGRLGQPAEAPRGDSGRPRQPAERPGAGGLRLRVKLSGIVQGVGMRPFLHRLARRLGVSGWARNTLEGVELELMGDEAALAAFVRELRENPPPLAVVERVDVAEAEGAGAPEARRDRDAVRLSGRGAEAEGGAPCQGSAAFFIRESSREVPGSTLIAPDTAPCADCLRELFDPSDRRFRYPFINCTNCGPRFTIIKALPYDRARTSMEGFPMCPDCAGEYGNIEDRRYHAQPDCCPACGPEVFFLDGEGELRENPFRLAQEALAQGGILAVKGIGGIHLACDAGNAEAVRRLRRVKCREAKPLAVMCASLQEAERLCRISQGERGLLASPRRPIVLCAKRICGSFRDLSENGRLGIMLPYSPLHALLLDGAFGGPQCLVMTSANPPECPVLVENEDAVSLLRGRIDGFLLHNRPIVNRCDDSLVMEWKGAEYFFRRSRGYAPQPVRAAGDCSGILALGGQQKASFALGQGRNVFLSQHIGDLDSLEARDFFEEAIRRFETLFRVRPRILACDLHPRYASAQIGEEMASGSSLPLLKIQHHWAHMASCMEDNGLEGRAFGIIWDGTGLGTDGTVWGAEFLAGDYCGFERRGSIRPILLPGGEEAIREIGRIALSLLWDGGQREALAPLTGGEAERRALTAMLKGRISCVEASSMGRLFDGVDAILENRAAARYEGEGAALLEALGAETERTPEVLGPYRLAFYEEAGIRRFDMRPMIGQIAAEREAGVPAGVIAGRFMETMASMALDQCLHLNGERYPVVLSGGVFQNRCLLERISALLEGAGFSVYCHRRVAANDQGISLGQLAIAQRSEEYHVLSSSAENNKN